jgi:hypothetical protein
MASYTLSVDNWRESRLLSVCFQLASLQSYCSEGISAHIDNASVHTWFSTGADGDGPAYHILSLVSRGLLPSSNIDA